MKPIIAGTYLCAKSILYTSAVYIVLPVALGLYNLSVMVGFTKRKKE